MSDRFFVGLPITDQLATLTGPEAHHLAHVMRAQVGQHVILFDGSGCEFAAEIKSISKRDIQLIVHERREVNRETRVNLTLAVALPKGERQRLLVEKAVELGVATLVPLETERGVAQPSDAVLERLRRAVAEASKQCGRNRLLEVRPAQSWKSLIIAPDDDRLRLLAHPGGTPLQNAWPGNATKTPAQSIITAIGPEGGFSEDEAGAALNAGWQTVDLGPRILRVETAAIAVAAWAAFSH